MSLNIITVTLNMGEAPVGSPGPGGALGGARSPPAPAERHHFLGISIVGQSNDRGDGGIYIGSIMKGGAVAADGRIEPGDMLLQVRPGAGGPAAGGPAPRSAPLPPGERGQLREHEQRRRRAGAAGDRGPDGVRPGARGGRPGGAAACVTSPALQARQPHGGQVLGPDPPELLHRPEG